MYKKKFNDGKLSSNLSLNIDIFNLNCVRFQDFCEYWPLPLLPLVPETLA